MRMQLFLILCLAAHLTFANTYNRTTLTDQSFPVKSPGAASLSSAVFSTNADGQARFYTKNSARQNVLTLENRAEIASVYWQGKPGQPMVYLIPGIGGTSSGGNINTVARLLQSWGMHVLTFHDPVSWQYNLTVSPDGVPGLFPKDSIYLYQHMQNVTAELNRKLKPQYSGAWIVSYSLGTQYAVELLKIDDQEKAFGFSKAVLMNPPLDIGYTLDKFDRYNVLGRQIVKGGLTYYASLRGRILAQAGNVLGARPEDQLASYLRRYNFTSEESEILLGGILKEGLDEVLYVASLIAPNRDTLFSTKMTARLRSDRYAEISKITFNGYFNDFIYPQIRGTGVFIEKLDNPHALIRSFSLKYQMSEMLQDPRIHFVLGEDDPISSPADISLFANSFGPRALVSKYGGHTGVYWFPTFQEELKNFLGVR